MYSLQNKKLQIKIKETGIELSSIIANGKEYLWQGNPDYWVGQAPILFPFVGRFKDDFYLFNGQKYSLPQHGFFRKSTDIQLSNSSETKCSFSLKSNENTLAIYPFEFDFKTSFELVENTIIISHEVENTGNDTMYFSLGEHPAFNCSLIDKNAKHDQCYLEFEKEETAQVSLITKDGYIAPETQNYIKNSAIIELPPTVFDKDALVFKKMNSKKVTIINKSEGKLVTVAYKDFPNLGIWAKPMAPYVCIEPWIGYADSPDSNHQLKEKEGVISLASKETYSASYSIEIH